MLGATFPAWARERVLPVSFQPQPSHNLLISSSPDTAVTPG